MEEGESSKMKCRLILGAVLCIVLAGCETIVRLQQPGSIPVFVETYEGVLLKNKTYDIPCVLNLVNVPKEATLTDIGISGSRSPGSLYPERDVVSAEFKRVVVQNFRFAARAEQSSIELKVDSEKFVLERDGDELTCDVVLSVQLLNPQHYDKPYFSKTYSEKAIGTMMDDYVVPECVYEAVQKITGRFVTEVNADSALVERLSALNK